MSRFHSLLQTNWFIILLQVVSMIALSVCMLIFPKKFLPYWSPAESIVMDIVFILVDSFLLTLCFLLKNPDFSARYMLFWLLISVVSVAAVFFTLTLVLNKVFDNGIACYTALTFIAALAVACFITQDAFCFVRGKKFLLVLISAFSLISYLTCILFSFELRRGGWLFRFFSEDKITFDTASYEELAVTEADKTNNKTWYDNNVVNAVKEGRKPAFDFALDGKKLSETLSDWKQSFGESYDYADGKGTEIILLNKKEAVQATVKAVWYEKTATCEWTVYLKNVGQNNSSVVSSFYPLDTTFDCASPYLYFSYGSEFKNTDFALRRNKIPSWKVTLDTIDGRTSQTYLPFFNISGTNGGLTVGIGWSGEWKAEFSSKNGTNVTVGQKTLEGYLTPGEEIRSPLVSLSAYTGKNALKGFNTFRQRVLDSLPDYYGNMKTFAFAGAEGEANMAFVGEEGTKRLIEIFESQNLLSTVDYAWYDAGWFDVEGLGEWGATSGDWEVDTRRYPNGLKAVSDFLHEKNIGMILWYEPERIPDRSKIYQTGKTNGWLLSPDKKSKKFTNYLWNMGDEEANKYMREHIDASIKENGVDFYRQDFNINPDVYWKNGDRDLYDGRKGFCENKYVVGEYKYLDYLVEQNPGLLIDNCASGGRRIDLEMCRRSIPLWRSDYNCINYPDLPEACQYQTYGLSLWLPLSNCGNDWTKNEYDYRSFLGPIIECYPSFLNGDTEGYKKFTAEYERIKEYFLKNYYPLTPCTMSDKQTVVMQFGDEKEGVVLVFARDKSKAGEKTFKLNGLKAGSNYVIKTIEGAAVATKSGAALTSEGFTLNTEKRTAYVIVYKGE